MLTTTRLTRRGLGYVVAVVSTGLTVLLGIVLERGVAVSSPFLIFTLPVIVTGYIGGLGPGLLATALSLTAGVWFFLDPRHTLVVGDPANQIRVLIFALVGITMSALCEVLHRGRRSLADEQTKLKESEERVRALADNVPVQMWMDDPDGHGLFANARHSQYTGLGTSTGRPGWAELLHPDDTDQFFSAYRTAVGRRIEFRATVRLRRHDGEFRLFDIVGLPRFVDGAFAGYVGCCLDVTERREAEETIRSLLRISANLSSTLDVDVLLDQLALEAMRLVGAESGMSGLWTADGMVVDKYFQFGTPVPFIGRWGPLEGLPGWLITHKVPYTTNDTSSDPRITRTLCAQFGVWSALSIPIINASGEILGFFEVHNKKSGTGFADRDRLRLVAVSQTAAIAIQNALAYRRIQQAEQALVEADRRKDEFLAVLAHELRNPLAPIANAVGLLHLAEPSPSVLAWSREIIDRQVRDLTRLVGDLLDLSRLTRGKIHLQQERIAITGFITSALEASGPVIDAGGHELSVSLPEDTLFVDGDETRLAQVVTNLLNNAAKYTPRGGKISLHVREEDDDVVIRVRDDGAGIPPEMLGAIFDMFTQVDRSLERTTGGLGIGLTLARSLVEMHGGSIEARSEGLRKGSEFIVRLPLVDKNLAGSDTATSAAAHVAVRPLRVLVVDDNLDAAESLCEVLRLQGHETHLATDGVTGVQAAETLQPDVALLDIGMPRMNGYDAARLIRAAPWGRNMMLVALTGWGQPKDKVQAAAAGFDHHMLKPVDFDKLQQIFIEAAERSQPADAAAERSSL